MNEHHMVEFKYHLKKVSAISIVAVVVIAGVTAMFLNKEGSMLSNAPSWASWLYSLLNGLGFADKSKLGFIAVIYYGISALTYPLAAICAFGFLMYGKDERSEWARKPFTKRQRIWVLPIATAFVVFSLLGLNSFHGQNSRYLRIEESVLAMALQGWIVFVGCGLILGVAIALIWKFFSTIKGIR